MSRSYIVLGSHSLPSGRGRTLGTRFYLDEDRLEAGRVVAPDGTSEQCDGCGSSLSEASVTANAHQTKITCDHCGENYVVRGGRI